MMKKSVFTRHILFFAVVFSSCCKEIKGDNCEDLSSQKLDTLTIQSSLKGWELYSWSGDNVDCFSWNYTIMPGTNRLKTFNEVTNDAFLKVSGEKRLKLLLSKFPANENILWVGEKWLSNVWSPSNINYGNLRLPSSSLVNKIKQHCMQKRLQLTVAE